jgi:hypothetical protein
LFGLYCGDSKVGMLCIASLLEILVLAQVQINCTLDAIKDIAFQEHARSAATSLRLIRLWITGVF